MLSIRREYHFEAGHFLPKVPETHKCRRQHGHNYKLVVEVGSKTDGHHPAEAGFVIDFWELDTWVKPVVELVDHRNLNDVEGLSNPTAENIAVWFWQKIDAARREAAKLGLAVYSVTVYEVEGSCAYYAPFQSIPVR
jgi:6-pyruvoyltetrahydropterin/6-carboxytetrahydropterin synthase